MQDLNVSALQGDELLHVLAKFNINASQACVPTIKQSATVNHHTCLKGGLACEPLGHVQDNVEQMGGLQVAELQAGFQEDNGVVHEAPASKIVRKNNLVAWDVHSANSPKQPVLVVQLLDTLVPS